MSQFTIPPSNSVRAFSVTKIGGIDLWNSPENVDRSRSPYMVNMIKDKSGSVRKRMGYERLTEEPFDGQINGVCFFKGKHFIHSGIRLYSVDDEGNKTSLFVGLPNKKSVLIPYGDMVYVISGGGIFYVTPTGECNFVGDIAYIPTVIISKSPKGGGTEHENYNLLSNSWREQFLSDGESTVYRLEKKKIEKVESVWMRNDTGDMELVDPSLYTVSNKDGTVTFSSPPPLSPVVGMDNVMIQACKSEGNQDVLYECTVGTIFGAGGKGDRLFVGGNPQYPGMDFFSHSGDFTYFPHMNYSQLSGKNVVGYSRFNGSLYTHFEEGGVVKRNGVEDKDGKDVFVIDGEFNAPAMTSPRTSLLLNDEALYLSKKGIYSITVSDVTSEKVCQLRSAFLGDVFSSFTDEELKNAHSTIFGDYYTVSVGGKMFLLDGGAKSYFHGTPLCSYQYECYVFENIPSVATWTNGERFYFLGENGILYRFFNNVSDSLSYTDDGVPVSCRFDTKDFSDGAFSKKKTYVSVSAKIGSFLNTGVRIYARTDGKWHDKPVYDSLGRGRYFDFSYVDFDCLSFSSNRSEVTLCGKVRIRNTDSVRFSLQNDKPEPFLLLAFGGEYVQKGNYIY